MRSRKWLSAMSTATFRRITAIGITVTARRVCGFSTTSSSAAAAASSKRRVVVVGKIIIDEYRTPEQLPEEALVSVGGGAPQAAFGAAAALAVMSGNEAAASRQPVTLVGAVGAQDWGHVEEKALGQSLDDAIDSIQLVRVESLKTPRIQLWHDADQNVQWRALHDSFGTEGADSLWRGRPSASDILQHVDGSCSITCHAIMEGGAESPGGGADSDFFTDANLRDVVTHWGVEPVVFPGEDGQVSRVDAESTMERFKKMETVVNLVSPDRQLYEAVDKSFWKGWEVGLRLGPKGSVALQSGGGRSIEIPAATLKTPDGTPVNPTGAGNAYAAALTACRGSGLTLEESACVASAIGAVMCEYDHIPPWTPDVLCRIREALKDIKSKL